MPKYKPKPLLARSCRLETCKKIFKTHRISQVFCSRKCRLTGVADVWREMNPSLRLPTATTGAIAELIIAVDLMRKGYSVFRAMSPSCHCDLAALLNGKLCRIEVRTGYRSVAGAITYPRPTDCHKFDVLALVRQEEILYNPPIEAWYETHGKPSL